MQRHSKGKVVLVTGANPGSARRSRWRPGGGCDTSSGIARRRRRSRKRGVRHPTFVGSARRRQFEGRQRGCPSAVSEAGRLDVVVQQPGAFALRHSTIDRRALRRQFEANVYGHDIRRAAALAALRASRGTS